MSSPSAGPRHTAEDARNRKEEAQEEEGEGCKERRALPKRCSGQD